MAFAVTPALVAALRKAVPGELREKEPLSPRTSVRVGGPADLFLRPRDPAALVTALGLFAEAGVPWYAHGGGANTIIGDGGVEGAVLRLGPDFADEQVEEGGDHIVMTLGAGAPSARFLHMSREHRGVGTAWAAGIPGTVGGLAAMNAGTPAGCMADHLESVEVATPEGLRWLPAAALQLSYRHCALPAGCVLTRVRCKIRRGTEADLRVEARTVQVDLDKRRATQPLSMPNSGSVFVNPPGDHAGRLIEAAGLKGTRQGGAEISAKHANFIVNEGDATAADVVALIALARRVVLEKSKIALTPEVRLVGRFDPPLDPALRPYHRVGHLPGVVASATVASATVPARGGRDAS